MSSEPREFETKIHALSDRHEGIGKVDGQDIPIPFTHLGETVRAEVVYARKGLMQGKLLEVLSPSPDRVPPACQHFGHCGGCQFQHYSESAYKAMKAETIQKALSREGLKKALDDFFFVGPRNRRRVDFWIKNIHGTLKMGFQRMGTRFIEDIAECPMMHPMMEGLLTPLRETLSPLLEPREGFHIHLVKVKAGVDILLSGRKRVLSETEQQALVSFAEAHPVVRLQVKQGKTYHNLHQTQTPTVQFGNAEVEVTPNCFLQASEASDQILGDLVVKAIGSPSQKVFDLFCGRGTLSLPLVAAGHDVHGAEGDLRSIQALQAAAPCPENFTCRDLYHSPYEAADFKDFDAIVLNPPRTGAPAQIPTLAAAKIPLIVYVSCNPETFAQDAHHLLKEGYTLRTLWGVDQFHWAHHVEVVGVFTRN